MNSCTHASVERRYVRCFRVAVGKFTCESQGPTDKVGWNIHMTEYIKSILNYFFSSSKGEVKTPLSFLFRVVMVLALFGAFGLLVEPVLRIWIFGGVFTLLFLMVSGVLFFAWCRPRNLVYGESGHRAEAKMQWGTEKKQLTLSEVAELPGIQNPMLSDGGDSQR